MPRTQFRLSQMTGSIGTSAGQINDQTAAAATGSLALGDLGGILSHMASAIKRIHGDDSFSEAAAGVFSQNITVNGTLSATGAADIGSLKVNDASTIGTDSDADMLTLTNGSDITIASDLDFIVSEGKLKLGSTAISSTATELNILDGVADAAYDASADSVVFFDASDSKFKYEAANDFAGAIAGTGLDASSGQLSLDVNELSQAAIASGDFVVIEDTTDSSSKKESIDDIATLFAGNGLAASSAVISVVNATNGGISVNSGDINIDLDDLAAAAVDVANDSIAIVDATDNSTKKESIADLVAGMASGTGIVAASGQLAVDGVLENLDTLGAPASDGEFIVATGAGAFAYESGNTARTSLGLGTGDSPTFTNLTLSGDLTVNGTQTILDTTSLVIDDAVIALASGSGASADTNAAIMFEGASARLGGGSDMTNGSFMYLQGTGFKLGFTNQDAETAPASLAIADDDLADLYVGKVLIDGSSNHIDVVSSDLKISAAADVILDAIGSNVKLQSNGTAKLDFDMSTAGQVIVSNSTDGDDIVFKVDAGSTEIMRLDDSASSLLMASTNQIQFSDANSYVKYNGTNIEIGDDADIDLAPGTNVNIGANKGLTFGDDGEKISGDGTDLTIASSRLLNLTATSDVVIPAGVGLILDGSGDEKIESDGSDLTIASGRHIIFDINTSGTEHVKFDGNSGDFYIIPDNTAGAAVLSSSDGDLVIGAASGQFAFRSEHDVNGLSLSVDAGSSSTALTSGDGYSLAISGSNGIYFSQDYLVGSSYTGFNGYLPLAASSQEYSDFATSFGATKSLLGAINSIGGVDKAILRATAAGLAAGSPLDLTANSAAANVVLSTDGVSVAGLSYPNLRVEAYVNGQLLLSGSETDRASGDADYTFASDTTVKFAFALEQNDIVQIIKR